MFTISIVVWCLGVAVIQHFIFPIFTRYAMGDGPSALLWYINKVYISIYHRLQAQGRDIIPDTLTPGALIVVCKHQSPIDPLIVQSMCRFKIRWLMAGEFMAPSLSKVWKHTEVIPVSRDGSDSSGLRTALRHLRNEGVIGIFPEGGIHQPREAIHPFFKGAGALIAHTKATVLLVSVSGTPTNDEMDMALLERSHSVVHFLDLIKFPDSASHSEITDTLRNRLSQATGWRLVD